MHYPTSPNFMCVEFTKNVCLLLPYNFKTSAVGFIFFADSCNFPFESHTTKRIIRACSTHGGEEACIQGFGGKARRKEVTRKT
jgi:hypothetical protein